MATIKQETTTSTFVRQQGSLNGRLTVGDLRAFAAACEQAGISAREQVTITRNSAGHDNDVYVHVHRTSPAPAEAPAGAVEEDRPPAPAGPDPEAA